MTGIHFLAPQPITLDPNGQAVHTNATITANDSGVFVGYGAKEVTIIVNVLASPTGTTPTLQYTLQEVDPGDATTVFGSTVSTTVINAVGVFTATLRVTKGGSFQVSWVVGGGTPSFTQVYATLTTKATSAISGIDGSGVERPVLVDNTGAVEVTGSISASNPSVGTNNAAIPTSSTQVGGSDGTNLQAARVFDADSGAGTQYVLGAILRKAASGGSVEAGTSSDPLRVDPTGTTTQPISDAGGSLTIDSTQLPAALVGGRLDINTGAWLGSTAPTVGQKTSANSIPTVIASDQSAIPVADGGGSLTVDGAVTANVGTTGGLALDATLTGGTQTSRVTDGTNTAAVKAASTAAVATDPALVVAISPNNTVAVTGTVTAANASVSATGAAVPASATQIGGSDGTNLQAPRVFDADTGGGTQYVLGAILRKGASGGSVEAGTSADPLRVDPTGTTSQPVTDAGGSLTVDSAQLPAALVGGRLDGNVGAWLGSTAPTVGSKTSANSLPVVIASDQAAIAIDRTILSTAGTLGALDDTISGACDGRPYALIAFGTTTLSGQVTPEVSWDNTNWSPTLFIFGAPINEIQEQFATPVSTNAWRILVPDGYSYVRVRVSTYTSGSCPATLYRTFSGSPPNPTYTGKPGALVPYAVAVMGGIDPSFNTRELRLFDADTGGGAQYVLGVSLRKGASGGSVEAGTSADPLRVDPTGTTTQPVSDAGGSLTIDSTQLPAALVGARLDVNNGAWLGSTAPTVGQKTMANSLPVTIASDQSDVPVLSISGTATLSNVASSATSVQLLAANTARHGATIHNDSTQILFLKCGTTASATSYTARLVSQAYYEVPFGYTGRIDGIWASANGNARVTEFT